LNVIDSIPIKGLRKSHLKQLAWCIQNTTQEGCYYGRKDYFMARQKDLEKLASKLYEMADDKDSVIASE